MHHITYDQIIIVFTLTYFLTPFITSLTFQLPKKMMNEYKNECLDFLEIDQNRTDDPKIFDLSSSRYGENTKKKILFYLPFISYALAKTKLKKESQSNQEQILLLETLVIIISLATFINNGFNPLAYALLTFNLSLIVIAFIDANTKLIPDTISLTMLWIGLLISTFDLNGITADGAIISAFVGYSAPWAISKMVCHRIGKPDGMGYGDFKMIAMLGAWLGVMGMLNTIILASVIFLGYFSIMRIAGKVTNETLIPFGPFLSIAAYLICQSTIFQFSTYLGSNHLLLT